MTANRFYKCKGCGAHVELGTDSEFPKTLHCPKCGGTEWTDLQAEYAAIRTTTETKDGISVDKILDKAESIPQMDTENMLLVTKLLSGTVAYHKDKGEWVELAPTCFDLGRAYQMLLHDSAAKNPDAGKE